MTEPVTPFDFGRMLLGDEQPLFLLEIAFRTIVIYVYTLFLIRWIGSRSIAQLSLVEFLLVIALGSAVGDAMFYADVPLIHSMAVITIVVLLDKLLGKLVIRNPRLEDLIEGKSVRVIENGVIDCKATDELNLGHDELFEQLRLKDIEQLGQVRAAYMETNGSLSVFRATLEKPGLSIVPPWDVREPRAFHSGEKAGNPGPFACSRCAATMAATEDNVLPTCPNCGGQVWHGASISEDAPVETA